MQKVFLIPASLGDVAKTEDTPRMSVFLMVICLVILLKTKVN